MRVRVASVKRSVSSTFVTQITAIAARQNSASAMRGAQLRRGRGRLEVSFAMQTGLRRAGRRGKPGRITPHSQAA